MKIITRGTPPAEREYRVSCFECKSVLQFLKSEAKEVKIREFDQRDGEYYSDRLQVQCPVCSKLINKDPHDYIKPHPLDNVSYGDR